MNKKRLTQEQELLLQSYFTFSLLAELKNHDFLNSVYYEGMSFGAPWIKKELRKIGVDNQGCALMALYAMLVIPRELIMKECCSDYDKIDEFLSRNTRNTSTNYQSDESKIGYLRHIRNAVAHARVEFRPGDAIIFQDRRGKNNFYTELPLNKLGNLIQKLQSVHISYLQNIHNH